MTHTFNYFVYKLTYILTYCVHICAISVRTEMAHPLCKLFCNILMCIIMIKYMGKEMTNPFHAYFFNSIIYIITLVCELKVSHTFLMNFDNSLDDIFGFIGSSNIRIGIKNLIIKTVKYFV